MTIGDGIGFSALCFAIAAVFIVRRWLDPERRCEHNWQALGEVTYYADGDKPDDSLPICRRQIFRCEKCGASRKYER